MKNLMLLFSLGTVLVIKTAQAAVITEPSLEQWANFKVKYDRVYASKEEEQQRMNVFLDNLRLIEEHNAQYEKGLSTFTLVVNKFADLTHEEFTGPLLNAPIPTEQSEDIPMKMYEELEPLGDEFDENLDWRFEEKNERKLVAVNPVKDQSLPECYSGWAFAAAAQIEGYLILHKEKFNRRINISAQHFVDCAVPRGCQKYDSAKIKPNTPTDAYFYLKQKPDGTYHRLIQAENYAYVHKSGKCQESEKEKEEGVILVSYQRTPPAEKYLQRSVRFDGPVSAMIDATEDEKFKFYHGGIYQNEHWDEKNPKLTHGITIVGYAQDDKGDYWILKNSFGEGWGENGYVNLIRNANNNCGIANNGTLVLFNR